jgi:O-antigen ligase
MNYIEKAPKRFILPSFLLIMSVTLSAYNINVGFSLKPYMILCAFIFLFSFYKFEIHKLRLYEVAMLIFYMYYCFTGLFAKYPEDSIRLIGAIIITFACYFIMRYIFSRLSIANLEKAISMVGILFNLISLMWYALGAYTLHFNFFGNGIRSYGILMDRGVPRLVGTFTDPNIFAFGNFIFFYYYLTHLKEKRSKLGLLLSTTTLLLTFSRGAILAVLFGIFIIFVSAKLKTKIKMVLFGVPVVYALIKAAYSFFYIDVIQIIMDRFKEVSEDDGSGRFDIWANGLELFSNHPIFGIGIYNYRSYSNALFGIDHYMHNTFLEVLTESGLIGFVLYCMVFVMLFCAFYKYRNKGVESRYLFYTLCSMMVLMSSLSLIVNECFFLFLAIVWRYFLEKGRIIRNSLAQEG